jgi:HD-GYP domain-containing protein (c-di-GMP phosphodiesterase class II)
MKKYKEIFSSTHTIYRLTTSFADIKNFIAGLCKTFKTALNADKVIIVCKHVNSQPFVRAKLENNYLDVKKGGMSILSRREREILNQEKAIITDNRMVHMFVFSETLGAVYVKRNPGKGPFNEIEKRWFLSLCESATMGLKIFQLYKEEHKTVMNSIKALNNMLKQYDSTSYLHTKTVTKLIKVLGKALKLTQAELRSVEYASMLHDAGAIQLPTNLLTKPDLTHDEYKTIMKHPQEGVDLIKNLEFLKPAIPIILHHHERYNGTGYPAKLKKEQIPIGSRVLAVLDAFDAMYFGRPYKKKKDLLTIIEELKKERGKQFDPRIIDTFLKILQRKNIRKYLKSCN